MLREWIHRIMLSYKYKSIYFHLSQFIAILFHMILFMTRINSSAIFTIHILWCWWIIIFIRRIWSITIFSTLSTMKHCTRAHSNIMIKEFIHSIRCFKHVFRRHKSTEKYNNLLSIIEKCNNTKKQKQISINQGTKRKHSCF